MLNNYKYRMLPVISYNYKHIYVIGPNPACYYVECLNERNLYPRRTCRHGVYWFGDDVWRNNCTCAVVADCV